MTTASKCPASSHVQGLDGVRASIDQVTNGEQAIPAVLEVDRAQRMAKCLEASVHVADNPVACRLRQGCAR